MALYQARADVTVEAVQWDGTNEDEVRGFGAQVETTPTGGETLWVAKSNAWCDLATGSYVMKEPDGSGFYPCEQAIFEARWQASTEQDQHVANDVVDVFPGQDGQWRWSKRAGNNRKVSTAGESFTSQSAAITAAHRANPGARVRVDVSG